jgi:SAM-dependent methyltransferase
VGGAGAPRRTPAAVRGGHEVAAAYDAAAPRWRRGPHAVYARLARALLTTSPVPLQGALVLDVGAGTGAAGSAALEAGAARVLAVDVAPGMLRQRDPRIAAAAADANRLPVADRGFDLAVAAMCLGHLPDPARAVSELRRAAGAAVASAFDGGWAHPAKAAVDDAMAAFGYAAPAWYTQVKGAHEAAVDHPAALELLARTAGFTTWRVTRLEVDSGLRTPADVVGWRTGMAHLAPFVTGLSPRDRRAALAAAEAAVADAGPLVIPILALSAS